VKSSENEGLLLKKVRVDELQQETKCTVVIMYKRQGCAAADHVKAALYIPKGKISGLYPRDGLLGIATGKHIS
jgi:hypothetical protein